MNNSNEIKSFFVEIYIQNITENIEKYDANNYKKKLKEKKWNIIKKI